MEPEGSLTYSQEPATVPYPELLDPVHTLKPYLPKILFNIFSSTA